MCTESKFIKAWCYTFEKKNCETKVKFNISYQLLLLYVSNLSGSLDKQIISDIVRFLQEHVLPHEQEMCFYPRMVLPIYDAAMITPHEGHHRGLKLTPIGTCLIQLHVQHSSLPLSRMVS